MQIPAVAQQHARAGTEEIMIVELRKGHGKVFLSYPDGKSEERDISWKRWADSGPALQLLFQQLYADDWKIESEVSDQDYVIYILKRSKE